MGHLSFYNKNQIRDKLLLVLIFYKKNPDSGEQETVMSMLLGPRKQENSSM